MIYPILLIFLLAVLTIAAYVDRVYSEMGKFLAREYQDNIDSWEEVAEPRFRLARESLALSASVLRQLTVAALGVLFGLHLYIHNSLIPTLAHNPAPAQIALAAFELILLILLFDRLIPQLLFARTQGLWIVRVRPILQVLFYLILPVTLLLGLLLSIVALAEPEDTPEDDHPSEAMDALLEAGEEEGILHESDRELVRSVVEFGDKVVFEIMTPRPEIFAVPDTLTLQQFTAEINEHGFSRVPVYAASLDEITGVAFARDLLDISDTEAKVRTVAQIQRPVTFVPETKKVAELLREMQREKQHMRIIIDEYGGVAGLVTIEDLLEAIVGNISDEHDEPEADETPVREPNGAWVVPGSFELSRLRDLLADQPDPSALIENPGTHNPADSPEEYDLRESREDRDEPEPLRLPDSYESTTLGGLVSEIAGHIPLPGEVVEEEGLRLEVLASTDRRIDRIRVSLVQPTA